MTIDPVFFTALILVSNPGLKHKFFIILPAPFTLL